MSVGGRVLDIAMEAYAITIVATLAGSLGSFMVKRAEEVEAAAAAAEATEPHAPLRPRAG